MATREAHNHGMALDPKDKKVQCNYCGKIVSGFNRLEQHLGGVGKDVLQCCEVPLDIKEMFRTKVIDVKVKKLVREVGDLNQTVVLSKRKSAIPKEIGQSLDSGLEGLSTIPPIKLRSESISQSTEMNGANHRRPSTKEELNQAFDILNDDNYTENVASLDQFADSDIMSNPINQVSQASDCNIGHNTTELGTSMNDDGNSYLMKVKKCIMRFFLENGIDLEVLESSILQKLMEMIIGSERLAGSPVPTICEVKTWILPQELTDMHQYIMNIRNSWLSTGCSILLDIWSDNSGRDLMNVLVGCPRGTIYLRSVDVSAASQDPEVLERVLDSVIHEVGIHNVVQVISNSTTKPVEVVGRRLRERYKSLFWTISVTHCIELILEAFFQMNFIKGVFTKAKMLTKFICGHSSAFLNIFEQTFHCDIVKSSTVKAAMPFLILLNVLVHCRDMKNIFASPDWNNSDLAKTGEGISIANLAADDSFWLEVVVTLRAAFPVIKALFYIGTYDQPCIGFIYELIGQVKEVISKEFPDKSLCAPFLDIIDNIYYMYLHTPVHAAAHFLNARHQYGENLQKPNEISDEMLSTVLQIVGDQETLELITNQVALFCRKAGTFKSGAERDELQSLSPVEWWCRFGNDCPHLQNLAVRTLSQTCHDGSSYGLRRQLAEKLLQPGMNCVERQFVKDYTYLQYNIWLQHAKPGMELNVERDQIDSLDDWI